MPQANHVEFQGININIAGAAGSGKSTVMMEISRVLKEKGFHVEIREGNEGFISVDFAEEQEKRLTALKGSCVRITTYQTKRGE
jgi:nucleoside-triphosphatase THEP1